MHKTNNPLSCFLSESRSLLRLSLPIIITQLATQGMAFVDTTMAGQASAADLAAIAVGASLWVPASLLLRGILMSLTPVTAHHRGAGHLRGITRDLGQTIWIALMCAFVLVLYLNQGERILTFMSVAPSVVPIAHGYLVALAFGVPGIALFYTLNSFSEGMGNTRAPMVIALIGLVINIPVNYVLIYGKLGFPAMGAVGCGWATSLVYWLMSVMMWLYIRGHHHYKTLLDFTLMRPQWQRMSALFKLGLPIGINIFVCGSIFAVIALLIGKLGANHIASAQVALNFSSMTYMIPMSLSFGITIRVGHALGEGHAAVARLRAYAGIVLATLMSLVSVSALLLFPQQIIAMYTADPEIVAGASALLVYTAIYQLSDAVQTAANGALRGYKDTRLPMWFACFSYWGVALPIGYTLAMTDWFIPAMGNRGFWFGIVIGLTLAALFMVARLVKVIRGQQSDTEPMLVAMS
ncbi:MATE family efflux transporter [Thaumasiovibrio subtropicus]|uniref:MATE family efflux transporter n=1 Tax=Thaumasiovibrio subtropicus TaxID=1891207 RepID=UPI000B358F5A|nr:MATE family efflux transporter [Thaumasiovibrio subtropicus]